MFLKNAKKIIPTSEPNTAIKAILSNLLILCKKEANNSLNLREAIMTCQTTVGNIQNKTKKAQIKSSPKTRQLMW